MGIELMEFGSPEGQSVVTWKRVRRQTIRAISSFITVSILFSEELYQSLIMWKIAKKASKGCDQVYSRPQWCSR